MNIEIGLIRYHSRRYRFIRCHSSGQQVTVPKFFDEFLVVWGQSNIRIGCPERKQIGITRNI